MNLPVVYDIPHCESILGSVFNNDTRMLSIDILSEVMVVFSNDGQLAGRIQSAQRATAQDHAQHRQ
jgi:hypothetical protein